MILALCLETLCLLVLQKICNAMVIQSKKTFLKQAWLQEYFGEYFTCYMHKSIIFQKVTLSRTDTLSGEKALSKFFCEVVGWGKGVVYLCVTRASNWYWFTVGQGLLSLQQVRVEGGWFYFFCFFTFFYLFVPFPLFHLPYYLFYLFSLSLADDTRWPTRTEVLFNSNTINQKFSDPFCKERGLPYMERSCSLWEQHLFL